MATSSITASLSQAPVSSNSSDVPGAIPARSRAVHSRRFRPPGYVLAALCTSIAGFLNGFDTGSIGGLTEMPSFKSTMGGELSPSMRGFTVSLILLAGALPSVIAGPLADRFGRPQTIMTGALIWTLGAALQGAAESLSVFLSGRATTGIGQGLLIGNVSVYITEIAPSATRGRLVSIFQMLVTIGLTSGYFTCYGSDGLASSLSWRLPFIVQCVFSVLLALSCFFLPMSPRWLVLHGRRVEALRAIDKLDISRAEAEKDFLQPSHGEQDAAMKSTWSGFRLIFSRGYRSRTILALFMLGMVQLCGIDGVLYYAPILFKQAGLPDDSASFLASGVSAILITAISVPACLFADQWSRRKSTMTGAVLLTGCMFLIGSLYAANSVHPWGIARWVVVASIFVFALSYAATWAVVGKIYASEIQPSNTRAAANCVAQGLNFFTNWLVAIISPIFLAKSASGAYFLFGGLSLGTGLILAIYMPETMGRSLESINDAYIHRHSVSRCWTDRARKLLSFRTTAVPGNGNIANEDDDAIMLRNGGRDGVSNASAVEAGPRSLRVIVGAV